MLSANRTVFGIHSFTPYNRSTGEFFGVGKILQSSSMTLAGELIKLNGGSNPYPWQIENGLITSEIALNISEYPDFLFELALGKKPTASAAQATGNVSTAVNKYGTSVIKATTGIATVTATAGDETDLKFGKYVIKAASTTTVDVYASTDVDFNRGNAGLFQNDLLKITASPITITTAGVLTVADYGLTLTGGSGTIAFVAGDTATFEVKPINSGSTDVTVGATSDTFPAFGALLVGEKQGSGRLFEIDCFNCKALGLPIKFATKAFSAAELTIQAFYDSTKNGVFSMREIVF